MNRETELVAAFHAKNGHAINVGLWACGEQDEEGEQLLRGLAAHMAGYAEKLLARFMATGQASLLRAHLIAEETSEIFEAMADRDTIKFLDGVGDTEYVLLGTMVTGFPRPGVLLTRVFEEIHRSNMSKQRVVKREEDPRQRDKGPVYSPPDLAAVLRSHLDFVDESEAEVV